MELERKRKAKIPASKPKKKKFTATDSEARNEDVKLENSIAKENKSAPAVNVTMDITNLDDKYPLLKDEELIKKFLSVQMTNNQKGRIRQTVKAYVAGASEDVIPQVLHDKMQEINNTLQPLNESSLRKMRILHNMLKTALEKNNSSSTVKEKKKKKKNKKLDKSAKDKNNTEKDSENVQALDENKPNVESRVNSKDKQNKPKGPKRYVVFVGNLPVDINADTIKNHFSNVSKHIQDIRIPVRPEGNKSCIAYVELHNEAAYEMALSKHHSMLANKRINVLYTAQKNSKISRTEAKSKAAKLVALQKAGKLVGSLPLSKKRSHRRALLNAARARENKQT